MAFTVLALLNVITGTFVQAAIERAGEVKDMKNLQRALKLFKRMDLDQNGHIALEDLNAHMEEDFLQEWFQSIDVECGEAKSLFELLDVDDDGKIDLCEFLDGCLRLQGPAKAVDLLLVTCDYQRAFDRQSDYLSGLNAKLTSLKE